MTKKQKSGTVNRYDSCLRAKDFKALQHAKEREAASKKISYQKIDSKTTRIVCQY